MVAAFDPQSPEEHLFVEASQISPFPSGVHSSPGSGSVPFTTTPQKQLPVLGKAPSVIRHCLLELQNEEDLVQYKPVEAEHLVDPHVHCFELSEVLSMLLHKAAQILFDL